MPHNCKHTPYYTLIGILKWSRKLKKASPTELKKKETPQKQNFTQNIVIFKILRCFTFCAGPIQTCECAGNNTRFYLLRTYIYY